MKISNGPSWCRELANGGRLFNFPHWRSSLVILLAGLLAACNGSGNSSNSSSSSAFSSSSSGGIIVSSSSSSGGSASSSGGAVNALLIEAEDYSAEAGTQLDGNAVGWFDNGDWLRFNSLDFGVGLMNIVGLELAVDESFAGSGIELRLDALDGPLIAQHTVKATAGWTSFSTQWANVAAVNGVHDLYLVGVGGEGGIANIDKLEFVTGDPIAAPTLTSIAIAPTFVVIKPGGQRQLSLSSTDQFGEPMGIPVDASVSWQSDAGMISTQGHLVAGETVGEYTAMVEVEVADGKRLNASVVVRIEEVPASVEDVIWAVNVGGDRYDAVTGITYVADEGYTGGTTSSTQASIQGTPDGDLYTTNRSGSDIQYTKSIENGVYQVTLRFAAINGATTSFDVFVEGEARYSDVDIIRGRDGRRNANYDLSLGEVTVADGELNISLVGNATLNAFDVRKIFVKEDSWNLIWRDEFDVDGPVDSSKWTHENWAPGNVNDELQRYTDRTENSRVENGLLIIEAHRDFYMGDEYSSARLHNRGKGDLLYGRVEVKAKLPNGLGTWAAIWMMPSNFFTHATTCNAMTGWIAGCDAWPNSGEIDIMEHVGYDTGQVWATVHNLSYYWRNFEQRKGAVWDEGVDDDFHVYAMEWTADRIDIFKDDVRYFTYLNEHTGWESWPYDHSYHVILNLAVGGGWGGAQGVAEDIWPKRMEVDYVRLYQK